MDPAIPQDTAWPMERNVQTAVKSATSEECVGIRVKNDVEQETAQVSTEESSTDLVNINSIHFNKNHSK